MAKIPQNYIPSYLPKKQRDKLRRELKKSRRAYKSKRYYTRKKVKGFKSKRSKWAGKVEKLYGVDTSRKDIVGQLSKATRCKRKSLNKIIKKGMGAYYSAGSRPNQTPHSWGYARLYSALSGGPAAKVDLKILEEGCRKTSKALRLGRKAKISKSKTVKIGGGRMKERIVRFEKSKRRGKKYTAIVQNIKTKKQRVIHFGGLGYQQYKDRTPLKLYAKLNHGTRKRMRNYFNRHSGTPNRGKAIAKEIKKSGGYYNPKILSHIYLW